MVKKSFPTIEDIHPVIRIVCLIIVSIFVVSAEPLFLEATFLLLVCGFAMGARVQLFQCIRVLVRLKWLFTSIFIIYLFLTPGRNIFPIDLLNTVTFGPNLNSLSVSFLNGVITLEGMYLGALRVCSLIILILTVNLLIQAKQHNELSYAIIWLLSPMKYIGCPIDRLAIRISLTFRYVSEFQQSLMSDDKGPSKRVATTVTLNSVTKNINNRKIFIRGVLTQAIEKSIELVGKVLVRVNEVQIEPLACPTKQVPQLVQWLLPLVLLCGYLSLL